MDHTVTTHTEITKFYKKVREQTEILCDPLEVEDFVVQPVVDVSPLKWHLGHTTWFFETFVLVDHCKDYKLFDEKFPFLFNSYYISAGDRWKRANRGQLTRPTVSEIFQYRKYVDEKMEQFLSTIDPSNTLKKLIELGCHHEQQHQELFLYDIKRILGDNPLYPEYIENKNRTTAHSQPSKWLSIDEGLYSIGHEGDGFHFDNEVGRHQVFSHAYSISSQLITNGEYMEFIQDGGYQNYMLWLSEAWDWVNENKINSPRYWHCEDGGEWWNYSLDGYSKVDLHDPVAHVSFYEADAFARWKGCRLPTEFEWEIACGKYSKGVPQTANFLEAGLFKPTKTDSYDFFGNLWEWTSSPYTPYPYFNIAEGALGEYNGKFMVNQMVLRGGSFGTSKSHIRKTYRNFFHPHLRWMFSGIRLAKFT